MVYDITYMWNLKIKLTSEHNKTETGSQIQRKTSGYHWGD